VVAAQFGHAIGGAFVGFNMFLPVLSLCSMLVGSMTTCLAGYELALTNPERSLLTVSGSFWLPVLDQKALILLCATSS
jgi:hypothetical protein